MMKLPNGASSRTHSAERSEKVSLVGLHVVRVGDPEVEEHQHKRRQRPEQEPPANPPSPLRSSPREKLATVKSRPCGRLKGT
jgi:hypothetical protein